MALRFTLTIDLRNDAMESGTDIATALLEASIRMRDCVGRYKAKPKDGIRFIRDENGNTVGRFEVIDSPE